MKQILLLCLFVVVIESASECDPKYHYWKQYSGTIPTDAFVASTDVDGTKSYIAKVASVNSVAWEVPLQFKEGAGNFTFKFEKSTNPIQIGNDALIEILCSSEPARLLWITVKASASELKDQCCFVEGGRRFRDKNIVKVLIASGQKDKHTYLGRTYLDDVWKGLHTMVGQSFERIEKDFQVLTYDCVA